MTTDTSWFRRELRAVSQIVPPVVAQFGSQQLMVATQLVYCGRLSRDALTSMSVTTTMFNILWMAITGAGGTMDCLGTQAHGSGDERAVKSWGLLTTAFLTLCCLPATAVMAAGKPISEAIFHADKERSSEIRDCALVLAVSFYPLAFTLGLQKYLACRRKVWAVGVTSMLTLAVTVGFLEAFVTRSNGGIVASCWAMVAARVVNLLALIAWVAVDERWWSTKGDAFVEYVEAYRSVTRDMVIRVVRLSMSGIIMVFGEAFAFELTVILASGLGDVSLGAHMIALQIATITFMTGPMAFGTAASIRVGNLLGSSDPRGAKRAAWLIVGISVAFMACCAVTILVAMKSIAELFTRGDADIVHALTRIAPFIALFQVFDGLLGCCNGVLRACGKQALIAKSNVVSLWLFGIGSAVLSTEVGRVGVRGLWWGLAIGVCCAGSFLAYHCARIDWVLEVQLAESAATNIERAPSTRVGESLKSSPTDDDEETVR